MQYIKLTSFPNNTNISGKDYAFYIEVQSPDPVTGTPYTFNRVVATLTKAELLALQTEFAAIKVDP